MNIINRRTINGYCRQYAEVSGTLRSWYHHVSKVKWESFQDIQRDYNSVDAIKDNRYIFNLKGGDYRLIVRISFEYKAVTIKWFGSHAEYNKIDANTINQEFKKF